MRLYEDLEIHQLAEKLERRLESLPEHTSCRWSRIGIKRRHVRDVAGAVRVFLKRGCDTGVYDDGFIAHLVDALHSCSQTQRELMALLDKVDFQDRAEIFHLMMDYEELRKKMFKLMWSVKKANMNDNTTFN